MALTGGLVTQPVSVRAQTAYDCATATGLPQAECEVLVAIYNATDGVNWSVDIGWLRTATPCTWYGVTCADGRVTRLALPNNQLSGVLPPEIGDLTALETLKLADNDLITLPSQIGNMSGLTLFDLSCNNLIALPAEIGNLTGVVYLFLNSNDLTVLPAEIGVSPDWCPFPCLPMISPPT